MPPTPPERLAVIAKLKPGSLDRAEELLEQGPPFELEGVELVRHSVFVSPDCVVLVFEGPFQVLMGLGMGVAGPAVSAAAMAAVERDRAGIAAG